MFNSHVGCYPLQCPKAAIYAENKRWCRMHPNKSASLVYKQNSGKINRSGNKNGTTIKDKPQVQVDPMQAAQIIARTVAEIMKHPPRTRPDTCTLVKLW